MSTSKNALAVSALLAAGVLCTFPLAAGAQSSFLYTFNTPGTLEEAGSMSESSSPYFWLNSGGKLAIKNGTGATVQNTLPLLDPWRLLYSRSNPLDTGNGFFPQSLFRLVTKQKWADFEQEVQFKLNKTILTDTPNRDGYSGILLMGRYKDGDNLYYAGIRHDGEAVIKKKTNGTYHTLAETQIFGVEGLYDRESQPNLISQGKWMRLKMSVEDASDGSVLIRLFIDRENDGSYVSILSARDRGTGGGPLRGSGYTGIRSDYMDLAFDNYKIRAI